MIIIDNIKVSDIIFFFALKRLTKSVTRHDLMFDFQRLAGTNVWKYR